MKARCSAGPAPAKAYCRDKASDQWSVVSGQLPGDAFLFLLATGHWQLTTGN